MNKYFVLLVPTRSIEYKKTKSNLTEDMLVYATGVLE